MKKKKSSNILPIKLGFLIVLVACLFVMGWLSADTESSLWNYSIWFSIIGLISLAVIAADTAIQESVGKTPAQQEIFETYVYEESWFTRMPGWAQGAIYCFVLLWGVVIFYQARGGFETISAPEYAVVGLGHLGNALISMMAGLIENYAWFSVGPALFGYVPFYFLFGGKKAGNISKIMGVIGFLAVGTSLWVGYHWFRYGLSDLSSTIDVAEFALFNLAWVVATKNIVLPTVWHSSNNLGYRLRGLPINWGHILLPIFLTIAFFVGFNLALSFALRKKKGSRRRRKTGGLKDIFKRS